MRNISKLYRLVNGFKRQNSQTILSYLDTLADDPLIYSERLKDIGPYLDGKGSYIYIDHWCLVLVRVDNNLPQDELASEDKLQESKTSLYFTEVSSRVSPVWQVAETLKMIGQKLQESHISLRMRGVLLTESNIINADDMKDIWEDMNVTVIDKIEKLSDKVICVNTDDDILEGTMAMDAIKDLLKQPESAKRTDDEEFQKQLDKFIREDIMTVDEGDEGGEEKYEEDTEDDEEVDSSESDNTDSEIPDGTIDQNLNLSIKVEILRPIANPREELDKLVGCQDVKKHMDELVALTHYNKMMRSAFPDAKIHEVSLHSVFLGRPGTGKTMVCKIFGSLLRQAGALSKGHVVVCDRGTFIGTLWGDEERSLRQVLEKAQGGVLMIDEAYLLNGKHESDPGRLIPQLLMEVLADETKRDIAVVLCGYKEPMMKMLNSNPGLLSRFPNRFEFHDFTIDELLEITRRRISEYQYHFTRQAWMKYRSVLTAAYQVRDPQTWGNARFVANQLERIFIQHAQRCVKESPDNGQRLLTLTPADIIPIEVPRSKPHIGF